MIFDEAELHDTMIGGTHESMQQVTENQQNSLWTPRLAAQGLLRTDARQEFSAEIFAIHRFWLQLVHNTSLPPNISCTHPAVLTAFRAIDEIIEGNSHRLARLAYYRLTRLIANLKTIVSNNRKHGIIQRSVGYRNDSVALDIYVSAQSSGHETRPALSRRIRLAKRWFHLGGPSPLLLIAHSDTAEHLVHFSGGKLVTNDNLRSLGNEVLHIYPAELVRASTFLTNTVDLAVKSGSNYDVFHSHTDLLELQKALIP